MSFKDMVAADLAATFLDLDTFGTLCRVEGKDIPIMLDNDELKEMQGGQDLAVAESGTLFYARSADLPPRRTAGSCLNINGRECIVDAWSENMGMATIVLRENIVA